MKNFKYFLLIWFIGGLFAGRIPIEKLIPPNIHHTTIIPKTPITYAYGRYDNNWFILDTTDTKNLVFYCRDKLKEICIRNSPYNFVSNIEFLDVDDGLSMANRGIVLKANFLSETNQSLIYQATDKEIEQRLQQISREDLIDVWIAMSALICFFYNVFIAIRQKYKSKNNEN